MLGMSAVIIFIVLLSLEYYLCCLFLISPVRLCQVYRGLPNELCVRVFFISRTSSCAGLCDERYFCGGIQLSASPVRRTRGSKVVLVDSFSRWLYQRCAAHRLLLLKNVV